MKHTILLPILLLTAPAATELRAQDGTETCASNNLKQLTLATLAAEKPSEVRVCAGSNGLFVFVDNAGPFPAQAQGCRASAAEIALGEKPRVSSRRGSDGRLAIRVNSSREPSCWITAILPQMEQRALPTAHTGGQGGGIYSSGDLTLTTVTVTDPETRQLIRSRRPGPGRMTIVVPRDSELAALFRAQLAGDRRPIPSVRLTFVTEGTSPADAPSATLSGIKVIGIRNSFNPASADDMSLSLNFEKIRWPE